MGSRSVRSHCYRLVLLAFRRWGEVAHVSRRAEAIIGPQRLLLNSIIRWRGLARRLSLRQQRAGVAVVHRLLSRRLASSVGKPALWRGWAALRTNSAFDAGVESQRWMATPRDIVVRSVMTGVFALAILLGVVTALLVDQETAEALGARFEGRITAF